MNPSLPTADSIAQSLAFSFGRRYLESPLVEATSLRPRQLKGNLRPLDPTFVRLTQIGHELSGASHPFVALQTVLTATHNPNRYTLLFLIKSDGQTNSIYLGVRPYDEEAAEEAADFLAQTGQFLQGNWPGTRLVPCDYSSEIQPAFDTLKQPGRQPTVTALTGVPSLKSGDQPGYPQSLDRLLRGMRGLKYSYLVVADPISEGVTNNLLNHCRSFLGKVHLLKRLSLSTTEGQGTAETFGTSEAVSHSEGTQEGNSQSVSRQKGGNFELGIGLLTKLFPPAVLLTALGPSFSKTNTTGTTSSKTETQGWTETVNRSLSVNTNFAQSVGMEFVNAHAEATEEMLQSCIRRFEQARTVGGWNVGVYFLAEDAKISQKGASQMRALLSGAGSKFEPIRAHDLSDLWKPENNIPNSSLVSAALAEFRPLPLRLVDPENPQKEMTHPLGTAFSKLETPLNTEELALLINLPRRETPGIGITKTADFSQNPKALKNGEGNASERMIPLGRLLEGGEATTIPAYLPLDTLNKHALITGITGSGKSTTCRKLITGVVQSGTPLMIIEPVKEEYVEWAAEWNDQPGRKESEKFHIFMPGAGASIFGTTLDPLHLNPFEAADIYSETTDAESRAERFISILTASLPMADVLPLLLKEAIREYLAQVYAPFDFRNRGGEMERPQQFPLLQGIATAAERRIRSRGYDANTTGNLIGAVVTRVQALVSGRVGSILQAHKSTDYRALFEKPVVINLNRIQEEQDKALVMAILMISLYEYRMSRFQNSGEYRQEIRRNRLGHLAILEEAHCLLEQPRADFGNTGNAQAKLARMFSNMLSEIRSTGQGLMLVDQVPSRLIADAVKNTNLKISHRLTSYDDRLIMASGMSLSPDQTDILGTLHPGEIVLRGDMDDTACCVGVEG